MLLLVFSCRLNLTRMIGGGCGLCMGWRPLDSSRIRLSGPVNSMIREQLVYKLQADDENSAVNQCDCDCN